MIWARQGALWHAQLPLGGWLLLGLGTPDAPPQATGEPTGSPGSTCWIRWHQHPTEDRPYTGWLAIPGTPDQWINAVRAAGGLIPDSLELAYWRELHRLTMRRFGEQGSDLDTGNPEVDW